MNWVAHTSCRVRQALKDFELSGGAPFGFEGCVLSSQQVPQARGKKAYKGGQGGDASGQ
jgi:hypothetical protein